MFGLGVGELVIILVIVLVIFGAGKLPELGEGLGRGIKGFRKEIGKPDEIDITPDDADSADGAENKANQDSGDKPGA